MSSYKDFIGDYAVTTLVEKVGFSGIDSDKESLLLSNAPDANFRLDVEASDLAGTPVVVADSYQYMQGDGGFFGGTRYDRRTMTLTFDVPASRLNQASIFFTELPYQQGTYHALTTGLPCGDGKTHTFRLLDLHIVSGMTREYVKSTSMWHCSIGLMSEYPCAAIDTGMIVTLGNDPDLDANNVGIYFNVSGDGDVDTWNPIPMSRLYFAEHTHATEDTAVPIADTEYSAIMVVCATPYDTSGDEWWERYSMATLMQGSRRVGGMNALLPRKRDGTALGRRLTETVSFSSPMLPMRGVFYPHAPNSQLHGVALRREGKQSFGLAAISAVPAVI